MSEKLDEMIAEVGGPVVVENGEAVVTASAVVGVPPLPDYVQAVTVPLVEVVGVIACDAAKVTHLERTEVAALSDAVNNLLRFYLTMDGLDEKTAAWLALGAVGLGVVKARKKVVPTTYPNGRDGGESADAAAICAENASGADIVAAQLGAVDALVGGAGAAAGA